MSILITGALGQLGNELQLQAAHHPEYTFHFTDREELDVCDVDAIRVFVKANEVDTIINCAAYTAVDKAETDEAACRRLNADAPAYLAQAAEEVGARLIHVSTDYVFDGTNCRPYTESHLTAPQSVYGRTKLAGEEAALKYCSRTSIVRTAWLYSTFGNNFVKTMLRLGRERSELGVVCDQIGTPTYAADLAAAIFALVAQREVNELFHFSDEGVCSWYDFACAIHELAGITDCRVRPLLTAQYPTPAHRPYYSVLDKSKIKTTLNIDIPHWRESLKRCIQALAS
jgi:dTDP-4-dehydrorhamnose reductase